MKMGTKRRLTADQVKSLVKEAKSDREIGWAFRVSPQAVTQFRQRNGIPAVAGNVNQLVESVCPQRDWLMVEMRKQGITFAEIGARIGLTENGAKSRFYRMGKPAKHRKVYGRVLPKDAPPKWSVCNDRFSIAMKDAGRFEDADVPIEYRYRSLPPVTHVARESTAAMAAL